MARRARWVISKPVDGISVVELSSWKYFYDYIREEDDFVSQRLWRGQRDADWGLVSSLDRLLRFQMHGSRNRITSTHLRRFKTACRGRRGATSPRLESDNDWWALGQHHGLATPLLDWTDSPFVALYFAFEKDTPTKAKQRAVWMLRNEVVLDDAYEKYKSKGGTLRNMEFVRPLQDDNPRLVNQSGSFTKTEGCYAVDEWVSRLLAGEKRKWLLRKIIIPDSTEERIDCLEMLYRMNINHNTLFPDLAGASAYCNKLLDSGV